MTYSIYNRIIGRIEVILWYLIRKADRTLAYKYARNEAHIARKKVILQKGYKTVNRQLKRNLKRYSKDNFGSTSFWPYLALFTEIRERFISGWIPEDYYWKNLLPEWNPSPYNMVCNFKGFDHRIFENFALTPLFIVIRGNFYNSDYQMVSLDQVMLFFREYNKKVVVKEEFGRGGKEVRIFESADFGNIHIEKSKNYVIQPYIEQYQSLNDLYPDSVNTFRVNTFIERDGSISVRLVFLRYGSNGSKVDNLASGGRFIVFDTDGKPAKYACNKLGIDIGERHENTGYLFSELRFPMYGEMLEKCKVAHSRFPYVRIIGWDVCIDKAGVPVLLEWNAGRPHIDIIEGKFGPVFPEIQNQNRIRPN
ncbi:sugar-transfer associated ATP-grasp [Lentimicrobium saccharophilum]|uniref:Sugar-transfer associated ATP-grasp n=1 Tax=Lentimicrobium saccharophilum TaxID=1678841 RepID=A0A0S7BVL7_9BACT|nr:sugar-transfer associated ATP-grasp domain-containing protein [Lentimicrobium saccharophilum]GAP44997.1 sugar-transfer associated ATP-grasp [Lentimicrobium saccharophilum]